MNSEYFSASVEYDWLTQTEKTKEISVEGSLPFALFTYPIAKERDGHRNV